MIGVVAAKADHEVVREFFELFKTPWEFYRENQQYDVLLRACDGHENANARLVLVYSSEKTEFDKRRTTAFERRRESRRMLTYQGRHLPVYGASISFQVEVTVPLLDAETGECLAFLIEQEDHTVTRIGYNLFTEIRTLLSEGQPPANAASPTLELHIALLRDLIIESGIELAEIPSVPEGFPFIVCLTHDVDHPSIRLHQWDHTMLGFLYRATLGSLWKAFRGHTPLHDLLSNWLAVLRLPFVYMGLTRDFWGEFAERYLQLEEGLQATYFVLPFKNRAGKTAEGLAPSFRAAKYGAEDIADTIGKLVSAGHEVALHGIDAWIDCSKGVEELQKIQHFTGISGSGVRMHWLYYNRQSPDVLERAGASYDSTVGYNETVGYRAGTSQVYRPLGTSKFFELPMHVMDTALFYPSHLALSSKDAAVVLENFVDNAVRFGGCLTVNWHDRSLAPDRLWGSCYSHLVRELKKRGAWFATASQATAWFRKRRSARFELDPSETSAVRTKIVVDSPDNLPGLRLRIHAARDSRRVSEQPHSYADLSIRTA